MFMVIFSSDFKKPLHDLVTNIVGDHWGERMSNLVPYKEIIAWVDKMNIHASIHNMIIVSFVNSNFNQDDTGWTLREIDRWFHLIRSTDSGCELTVPDPEKPSNEPSLSNITKNLESLGDREKFYFEGVAAHLYRWVDKHNVEELRQAEWCIQDLINHLESEEKKDEAKTNN